MKSFVLLLLAFATMLHAEETAPENMQEHFAWCDKPKARANAIARFEGFWKTYLPAEEGGSEKAGRGYGDASHIMHVRLCAYRLLKLHLAAGNQDQSNYYAAWLEATDPMVGAKPPKLPKPPK